jgi:hypothetical protein
MKIFNIAILSGGICSLLVLSIFGYEIIILNNDKVLENVSEYISPPILGIFIFAAFVFVFIATLIAFPYYLYKSIPFVVLDNWLTAEGRRKLKDNSKNITGLIFCSVLIFILVIIAEYIQYKTP